MPDLEKLLKPQSIVLIGASNDASNIRGRFVNTMTRFPYPGRVYYVSRSAKEIAGKKTYPTVADLSEKVDLAILLVPAKSVCSVLEDCGQAAIAAAIVIASGFSEEGSQESLRRQSDLQAIAQRYDIALCGPNSEGFADLERGLAATFSPVMEHLSLQQTSIRRGNIAVLAQSGALGYAFMDCAAAKRAPVNFVLTTGNEACLGLPEYLWHLVTENETDVFLLLFEGLRDPALFVKALEAAKRANKSIVAVKIGRSEAGKKAAISHTGALAGDHSGYRAVFERYGVIEAQDIDEAMDLANCLARFRHIIPQGKRIGIVSASGGGGGWMADACADRDLFVPPLDAKVRKELDLLLPSYGSSENPVDITAQGLRPTGYSRYAEIVSESVEIDAVVVICSARTTHTVMLELDNLDRIGQAMTKPILFWSYSQPNPETTEILSRAGFPLLTSLRNTTRALVEMAAIGQSALHDKTPTSTAPILSVDEATRAMLQQSFRSLPPVVCEMHARRLLADYGLPFATSKIVSDAETASQAVADFNQPCAMKIQSVAIPHRFKADAIRLNVMGSEEARKAFGDIFEAASRLCDEEDIEGVLVEPMARPGIEVAIGATRDETFGPLIMIGSGGIQVETHRDATYSPLPIDWEQANLLVDQFLARSNFPSGDQLEDFDTAALAETFWRTARFVQDHCDHIQELDLNPVIVHQEGQGISLIDALIVKSDKAG